MRFPQLGRWEDAETGDVLLERLFVANTFVQRFRGLQFARPLDTNSGLLLRNCRSVHTMWMRFPIDLVFLSHDLRILEIRTGIKPWRVVTPTAKGVAHVIEVTAGIQKDLPEGSRTRVVQDSDSPALHKQNPIQNSGSPRSASGRGADASVSRSPRPASGRGAGGEGPIT